MSNSGQLRVSIIRGISPNFRITLNEDSFLDMESEFRLSNQTYLPLPAGTYGQRPGNPAFGSVRYNTELGRLEMYYGTSGWVSL